MHKHLISSAQFVEEPLFGECLDTFDKYYMSLQLFGFACGSSVVLPWSLHPFLYVPVFSVAMTLLCHFRLGNASDTVLPAKTA